MIKSAAGRPSPPPPRRKVARSTPSRRFRGVYERQPGRWAAEFRSHRPKLRCWIGTFPSEEGAKAAYDVFVTHLSRGASVEDAVKLARRATATGSVVLDEPDQSEIGVDSQADDLSTASWAPGICASPLTSSPPPSDVDEHKMEDPFLAEHLAYDGSIGLADLADLPLPSLDDKLDFGSGDWSMLNIDQVQTRNL
ncbi:unnamed protein product [Alopecurus aequalis]